MKSSRKPSGGVTETWVAGEPVPDWLLRSIRIKHGQTQQEAADTIGISKRRLQHYEYGTVDKTPPVIMLSYLRGLGFKPQGKRRNTYYIYFNKAVLIKAGRRL